MSQYIACTVFEQIEYDLPLQLPENDVVAERLYVDAYDDGWKSAPVAADRRCINEDGRNDIKETKNRVTGDSAVFALKRTSVEDLLLGKPGDRALAGDSLRRSLPIAIELKDGVSVQFANDVRKVVVAVPPAVLKVLADSNYRYVVADCVTNALPSLRGARPRGWPSNTTWDNADGIQYEKERVIAIAEYARDSRGQLSRGSRMPGVLRHETGHALDVAMADGGRLFSQSDAFKAAYERDVRNISTSDRKALGYFLQSGDRGRSETFADCFALLIGGPVNARDHETLKRAFPEVLKFIDEAIKNLERM